MLYYLQFFGGRGSSSGKSQKTYTSQYRGTVSGLTAGIIYKHSKSGELKILPETVREVYQMKDAEFRTHMERYTRDPVSYDLLDDITTSLMNKNFKDANKFVKQYEERRIRAAGKRSPYYKYQK